MISIPNSDLVGFSDSSLWHATGKSYMQSNLDGERMSNTDNATKTFQLSNEKYMTTDDITALISNMTAA